jgi:hypothetical protein
MVGPQEKEEVMQSTQGLMTRLPDTHYAAIYARVSTEDQGKGFSIPTQVEACQKLPEREGYAIPKPIAQSLHEEMVSGYDVREGSL